VHVAIADSQTANGYSIFDLVLSTVHLNANERLILDFKVEMNFSSPDDMFTHSETQTKLRSILQITLYISLDLLTNKYRIQQPVIKNKKL
jgi:hypothetical protein